MKTTLSLFLSLLLTTVAYGQSKPFALDHAYYLNQLGSAKDSLYQTILSGYDTYIFANPKDAKAQLERCRFIQHAYYDAYEDYNPNAEEAEACSNKLIVDFPNNPEVLLYPTDFLFGDSLRVYLLTLRKAADEDTITWKDYTWEIFHQLALSHSYEYEAESDQVILYGELALANNDTLDLSIVLAEAYKKQSNKDRAIELLLQHLDSTNTAWDLNRKGELLLDLGQPTKAMEAFHLASKKNVESEDAAGLAKAMIENGLVLEARDYLFKDFKNSGSWGVDKKMHALLVYDLSFGLADSARVSYRRFTDSNFFNDPVGLYRLQLIAKDPLMGWSFGDVGRVLMMFVFILVAVVIPYLWVLPIHYIGTYLKQKGKIVDEATFRWRLRHFWLACTMWIICDLLAAVLFSYPAFITYFNDQFFIDEVEMISLQEANLLIFFTLALFAFTLALMKWEEIKNFFHTLKANLRSVGVGIGLAIVLRFGLGIYYVVMKAFGISIHEPVSGLASVTESIISVNKFYHPVVGLLILVILVPIYEEILFRGIFLSACQRNMKFMVANILQSLVFALAHNDFRLLPFFLAFGFIAGHYTRKTGSLITGVSMHMMNNLLAFLGIYFLHSQ